jgi:hypothetical protein
VVSIKIRREPIFKKILCRVPTDDRPRFKIIDLFTMIQTEELHPAQPLSKNPRDRSYRTPKTCRLAQSWLPISRMPCLCLFVILLTSFSARATTTQARIFGTLNGYDSGGDDAICWESQYNETRSERMPSDILQLNQILVDETTGTAYTLEQMPACYSGTNFSIAPVNLSNKIIFPGTEITFQFLLTTSLSEIDHTLVTQQRQQPENITVWFRLLECDARAVGFCNPFVDINDWDEMDLTLTDTFSDNTPDDPFDYQEGSVLLGIPGDEKKHTFSSRWIRARGLTKQVGNNNSFETSLNVTTVVPENAEGLYFFIGKLPYLLDT